MKSLKPCRLRRRDLLVDATQGVEAQTVTNFNLAKELKLNHSVINKIDLQTADVERVKSQLVSALD